jgi:hypothetical protein
MEMYMKKAGQVCAVCVPKSNDENGPLGYLVGGSAIVVDNKERDDDFIIVYFEGNVYNAENLKTYADKVYVAYSRLVDRYPTIAKTMTKMSDIELIGTFNGRDLVITNQQALDKWINRGIQ